MAKLGERSGKNINCSNRECGVGVFLEPHHIVPLREDITRAFELKNGITLCRACHKKTLRKEHLFEQKYLALIGN